MPSFPLFGDMFSYLCRIPLVGRGELLAQLLQPAVEVLLVPSIAAESIGEMDDI